MRIPAGASGYDPNDYGSPQGGLLGRLLALQAEQSQYNGQSQGFAGVDSVGAQGASGYGPSAAQTSVAQPGQGSTSADASAPSRQLSSRRVPVGVPAQPSGPIAASSPYDPKAYDSQGAGGLFGRLLATVQPDGVQPNSGSGSNSEYDPGIYHDQQNGLIDRLRELQQQQATYQPTKPMMDPRRFELARAITNTSQKLGIDPQDLATAISYETAGTFDPWKAGPVTQYGQHRGLIQWGEPQARHYGVTKDSTITQQLEAVGNYLSDAGVMPNSSLLDIYSAINAGKVGRADKSDANNGGAPGTVADKVNNQMSEHRAKAAALLREYSQTVASQPGLSTPAVFPSQAAPIFPEQSLTQPEFRTLRRRTINY